MRRLGHLLAAAALVPLLGCSAGFASHGDLPQTASQRVPLAQVQSVEDPRSLTGPTTAVLGDRSIHPVGDAPVQALPVTVTSHDASGERRITVTDTSRVVALDLAGSIAATIWGLGFGDTLVGRDIAAEFPGTEDLPVVTRDGHSINPEAVIDLEPSLVITDGSIGPRDVVEQLRDVGITVVFVDKESSSAGSARLARDVATIYGAPEVGEQLAGQLTDEVEDTTRQIRRLAGDGDPLRMAFLYLRGSAGVYYLFGEESGAAELISRLGGVDVAAEEGWGEMVPLTDEAMLKAQPDVILVMTSGLESVGGVDQLVADKPAIGLTPAGERGRFVDMADADVLSFGPRTAAVLDALARAVYAPESL